MRCESAPQVITLTHNGVNIEKINIDVDQLTSNYAANGNNKKKMNHNP